MKLSNLLSCFHSHKLKIEGDGLQSPKSEEGFWKRFKVKLVNLFYRKPKIYTPLDISQPVTGTFKHVTAIDKIPKE